MTSKYPASSTRSPGTSRRGSPASAASAPAVATNGNRCSDSAIGRAGTGAVPGRSISPNDPLPCPDRSRYGWWPSSMEPTSTGAI
ncbi:hypothetical protein [Actinomadura sp. KC345]|uniref:hypothetical protein n=1 Tax=Actinomadura sp. KC345 TaxID=2530371 RepID=UPI001FB7856F|nr:hypothetical protein [Actinomadura sp. KC345]